jgi:hypothetical protein
VTISHKYSILAKEACHTVSKDTGSGQLRPPVPAVSKPLIVTEAINDLLTADFPGQGLEPGLPTGWRPGRRRGLAVRSRAGRLGQGLSATVRQKRYDLR